MKKLFLFALPLAAALVISAAAQDKDMQNQPQPSQAQKPADQATTRITSVETTVSKLDQYQPVTQAEIRFRPGQAVLNKASKEALDEMAMTLKDQKGYILEVQGFSSGSGGAAIENSRQTAQAAARYMGLNHHLSDYRIYTFGMGKAPIQTTKVQS